jgi:hypothetical protein
MAARKDIRSLTYSALAIQSEFSRKKWTHPNDEVFNKLGDMIKEERQDMIADFLNLFYYFIICYSKKCFKKHGDWQTSKYKLSKEELHFNYKLANEYDSHSKLLEIQQRMNQYRKDYKYAEDNGKLYLNDDRKREIILFIEESLAIICTDVQEPVIFTSYDIKSKIAKYSNDIRDMKERKKHKKSPKLNYAVLAELGLDVSY